AGRRAQTRHQHGRSLQGDVARGQIDRLFARLQRHKYRRGDRATRPHRSVEEQDDFHHRRSRHRLSGARRLRDRHSADQHHGRRAWNGLCRTIAGFSEQAVHIECWSIDEVEGGGGRPRDDPFYDFPGGRAAAPRLNLSTHEIGVWSIDSKKISRRSIVAGIAALCVHGFARTAHAAETRTLAERLATYAAALRYEDLDAATVERVKSHVIDTLGCGIAAFDERPVRVCREIAQSVQGAATIIGTARKTSPDLAAFANGA